MDSYNESFEGKGSAGSADGSYEGFKVSVLGFFGGDFAGCIVGVEQPPPPNPKALNQP